VKHREVGWEVEFKALVVAEVRQAQMSDMDDLPPAGILDGVERLFAGNIITHPHSHTVAGRERTYGVTGWTLNFDSARLVP